MNLLLVEDNPADARLVSEAVAEHEIAAALHCAADGTQALQYLRTAQPLPDLVLLDLNLPGLGGKEVLREMKGDPALKRIPVVVLTSSAAPQDVFDAYDAHANAYMIKPADYDAFLALIGAIETYWLRHAQLPSRLG